MTGRTTIALDTARGAGDGAITVDVRRHPAARRLTLRVDPAGPHVRLTVPPGVSLAEARRFVRERADWVIDQLATAGPRRRLEPQALLPFRGTDHRIDWSADRPRRVGLAAGRLTVGGPRDHVEARVVRWLKGQARARLTAASAAHAGRLGVAVGRVAIRDTRSRWGSCSGTGTLSFSWRLILAPDAVLDYVAAHEVAHLREMNHSPAFWALVDRLVPDASASRRWLKRTGAQLMLYGPPPGAGGDG